MADSGQAPAVAAAFPDPPPYWKHFSKSNLSQLRELQRSDSSAGGQALPDPLNYLVPPEPPADGRYRSFGVQNDVSSVSVLPLQRDTDCLKFNQPDASLEAAGIVQIYQNSSVSTDPTPQLLALSRAILLNFLELVGIMSNNPDDAAEKIEDLQVLFYNAHDLINQYRPHQARESLIMMMEDQLERSKAEIAAVNDGRVKLLEMLQAIQETGEQQDKILAETSAPATNGTTEAHAASGKSDAQTRNRKAKEDAQWEALKAEFG